MAIGNSINTIAPVMSSITLAADAAGSGMGILAPGATVSWQSDTVNDFLKNIIRNPSPAATETLLIGVSFSITLPAPTFLTNPAIKFYISTDNVAGSSGTFNSTFLLGPSNAQANCFMQVPVLVSDIAFIGNSSLVINVINQTGGANIDIEGISRFMPVTYLYNGLVS